MFYGHFLDTNWALSGPLPFGQHMAFFTNNFCKRPAYFPIALFCFYCLVYIVNCFVRNWLNFCVFFRFLIWLSVVNSGVGISITIFFVTITKGRHWLVANICIDEENILILCLQIHVYRIVYLPNGAFVASWASLYYHKFSCETIPW